MRVDLASGLTLSYTDQGGGFDPAVLLLPGPTDSWRSYQPVLDHLPHSTRAISVSPRGHGDSDKPDTGYDVQDFATDAVLLLDALGIRRAVVAGHSGSCLVARRIALDHPDRVAGLILEASPTTLRDDPRLADLVESLVAELQDPISPDFARSFVAQTSAATTQAEMADLLVEELLKVPAHVWRQTFSGLLRYDDTTELARVGAPTLLIWGSGDTLVSRDMQAQLEASIPNAELVVYPGVGHTPRWEHPVRFSTDVKIFARRVARSDGQTGFSTA